MFLNELLPGTYPLLIDLISEMVAVSKDQRPLASVLIKNKIFSSYILDKR